MPDIPDFPAIGDRARLFPTLAMSSKEGRALSIFLSCFLQVGEFHKSLLASIGQRVGTRARIEAYTEVVFTGKDAPKDRPDGLIVVTIGKRRWCALVEAKIGAQEIQFEQIDRYYQLCKKFNIDAIITISNQFATDPSHHPIDLSSLKSKKINVYHWSWMYLMTVANIMVDNSQIEDKDQNYLISELVRFLVHESTGVKGFDRMPKSWSDLVSTIKSGGNIGKNSNEAREIINAWHQEQKDICLILSRIIGEHVEIKISRSQQLNKDQRIKNDIDRLCEESVLQGGLSIPNAAALLEYKVDAKARTITAGMKLGAPQDKKSATARINWLLRQLTKATDPDVYVGANWPGRAQKTVCLLSALRDDVDSLIGDNSSLSPGSFDVMIVRSPGANFSKSQKFIEALEEIVPKFYDEVGQHLKAWQPPAPKVDRDKKTADKVTPATLQTEYEALNEAADSSGS